MKKKLISTALILAALVSFNLSAQQPENTTTTCTENTTCHKAGKQDKTGKNGRRGNRPDLFKGITLSAEQQSQLEALRPARPEAKAGDSKDTGTDKAKGDRKNREKKAKSENRRDGRKEYISKVKEILTPEQYVVFLENIASQPAGNGHRHGKKPHHDGARTVCPEEGNCPAEATK